MSQNNKKTRAATNTSPRKKDKTQKIYMTNRRVGY